MKSTSYSHLTVERISAIVLTEGGTRAFLETHENKRSFTTMRRVILGVFLAAAVAVAAVGCGKKSEQPSSSVQAGSASSAVSSEAQEPASSSAVTYDSLADWYTGEKVDFSELNEQLAGAVEGYTADVRVEGDTLIFRYVRAEAIGEDDTEAMDAENEKLEAYYAEGEETLRAYCEEIAKESGISDLKAVIEVMNEDTTNAAVWKELG